MKKLFLLFFFASSTLAKAQLPATWIQVPVPTTKDLKTIDFPTPLVGFIGGEDSLLLKTTDGGLTWNHVPYTGINFNPSSSFVVADDFLELNFVTDQIGYAAVGFSTYRTADGGLTWTALASSPALNHHRSLYFFADGEGVIGGFQEYVVSSLGYQKEYIDRFTTGTSSPVLINAPSALSMDTISDINFDLSSFGSVGLAVSTGGRIFRTIDGGITWDSIQSPLGNQVPLKCVTIVSSNLAFIGYDSEAASIAGFPLIGLLFSIDGGATWGIDGNSAFFAGPTHNSLHTTSNGRTYCGAYTSLGISQTGYIMELADPTGFPIWNGFLVDEEINSMTSHSDTIVWGAGNNGYLVKRGPAESLSINENDSKNQILVFPNPATSEINIIIPNENIQGSCSIELYEIDGKLLKSGIEQAANIAIDDLDNGTYIFKVKNKGQSWSGSFIKQ
jgi:photosystem II stability/assembly factor-like uncharacterized protein